jgi:hypothetical protein
MAEYLIQDTTLTGMANKIRSITDGRSEQYTATQMVTELGKMESEIDTQTDLIMDLIDAINNLPDAGGEDLEALGALCSWDVMTDASSYPVITIYNRHPTYYLKCTIYNDGDMPANFDDGSGTVTADGAVTVYPDDWATFIIEDRFVAVDSEVYVDGVRWTKNA